MKEFQFKYTIPKKQLFILLISIIIFILFEILGIFLKLSHLSYILGSFFIAALIFDKLKLSINRNYCNSLDFDSFCKDAIEKINDYKQGVDIPQNQTVGGFPIL